MTWLIGRLYCHHLIIFSPVACPDSSLSTQDKFQTRLCFQTQKQNQFPQRYLNLRLVPHNWNQIQLLLIHFFFCCWLGLLTSIGFPWSSVFQLGCSITIVMAFFFVCFWLDLLHCNSIGFLSLAFQLGLFYYKNNRLGLLD